MSLTSSNSINNSDNFFRVYKVDLCTERTYRLCDVFFAINNFTILTLDGESIKNILLDDLHVPAVYLKQPLLNVLEEAVLYYCRVWEGWEKPLGYYEGFFRIQLSIVELQVFVSAKCRFIIEHSKEYVEDLEKNPVAEFNGILSELVCPYKVIIAGAPLILNNTVMSIVNEDIFIRLGEETTRTTVPILEFLNWPFLSVEIKLLDLHLKRTNCYNFQRFISKVNQKIPSIETNRILNITRFSNNGKPYTHFFFKCYGIQLFNVLQKLNGLHATRVKELSAIYMQFLDDMQEMRIANGSMCTDTTVKFHLSGQNYSRLMQVVVENIDEEEKEQYESVHFVEFLMPEVELSLFSCTAVQDVDDINSTSFTSLNSLNKKLSQTNNEDVMNLKSNINNTCIEYGCTFCNKKFGGNVALKNAVAHFSQQHKVGQPYHCVDCLQTCTLKSLTKNRWKHECTDI